MNDIVEYPYVLSELICEDILEKIDFSKNMISIPKNDAEWNRAERLLYKTLLIHLNQYKLKIIDSNPELARELGNKLKLEEFTIQKVQDSPLFRTPSRKHVVSFILFLTNPEGGELKFTNKIICRTYKIGGDYLDCVNISYTYHDNKPVSAKLPHLLSLDLQFVAKSYSIVPVIIFTSPNFLHVP